MTDDTQDKRPEPGLPNDPAEAAPLSRAEREARTLAEMAETRYMVIRRVQVALQRGYVLRKVGQAYMVMPTGPRMKDYQGMITLNETGAFLYKELEKPDPTEEKMIEACKAEYGATDEEAKEAVAVFVQQCAQCGLLAYEEVIVDKETGEPVSQEQVDAQQQQS